jgi:hypothetical protein
MKMEEEFPEFDLAEPEGSFLRHEICETPNERYVVLRVTTESGGFVPLDGSTEPRPESTGNIGLLGQRWLLQTHRKYPCFLWVLFRYSRGGRGPTQLRSRYDSEEAKCSERCREKTW